MNKERLLKLATHLQGGELGHDEFDFCQWHQPAMTHICGSAGCAIGECPFVFPEEWCFSEFELPTLRGHPDVGTTNGVIATACIFFDLPIEEARTLFVEGPSDENGKYHIVVNDVKPSHVASWLFHFVEHGDVKGWRPSSVI